ncbi:MAG TPA: hypothetical protein VGQ59_10120 [Cyclobacteriaceae bacterium]|jgi:hypothetical protein|nr:hypothetical protein [Cyclobacteriaceae bacterium]
MRSAIVILFVFVGGSALAQDSYLVFRTGVGTYSMKTEKTFRNEFLSSVNLPLRVTDDFPPYFTFGVSAVGKISSNSAVGISFDYMSTGGRLSYKDYSGYALLDQNLIGTQYGVLFQTKVNRSQDWSLLVTFNASLIHSVLSLTDALSIGTSLQSESEKLTSNSYGLRPGIMAQKKIRRWVFQAGLGYEFQTSEALKTSNNKYLFSPLSRIETTADWSGVRLSIGAGILLYRKAPEPVNGNRQWVD